MPYLSRACALIRAQPLLLAVPIVLALLSSLSTLSDTDGIYLINAARQAGTSPFIALLVALVGIAISAATASGYNAMVASAAAGNRVSPRTFLSNLSRHYLPMVQGLAVVTLAIALTAMFIPGTALQLYSVIGYLVAALSHIWLAAVAIDGKGAWSAFKTGYRVLINNLAVFAVVIIFAAVADYLLPKIFMFLRGGYGPLTTWKRIMDVTWSLSATALTVWVRVAVFTAYQEIVTRRHAST